MGVSSLGTGAEVALLTAWKTLEARKEMSVGLGELLFWGQQNRESKLMGHT